MDTIRAFSYNFRALFSKKGRLGLPLPLPSCVPVSIVEYVSISLNILKCPWKCLNKLFWLCQDAKYVWSPYMFDRLLKVPQFRIAQEFWIWHRCICRGYANFWTCLNMAQYASIMPEYVSICLNVSQNVWT